MATFFFDIDGTLAAHGQIVEEHKLILKQLRDLGHTVCICTGRPYAYAAALFDAYVDGYVASNGRYLVYQGRCVYELPLTVEEITDMQKIAESLQVQLLFYGTNKQYACGMSEAMKTIVMETRKEQVQLAWDKEREPVYSLNVCYQPPNTIEILRKAYAHMLILNDHDDNFSADATTMTFDKGNGIEKLLELLNLSKEDTYAFGDGANDVSMFRVCCHTIAMGNAVDELKERANYITSHFQQHGIRKALCYYHILPCGK